MYTIAGYTEDLTLSDMTEPGKGYKLYLAGADPDSCNYPDAPPLGSAMAVAGVVGEGDPAGAGIADGAATGDGMASQSPAGGAASSSINYHAYQHNMTVTAVLNVGGEQSIDENDIVGAFVGEECRGVARPIYVDGVRRYEIFLMVFSGEVRGSGVYFCHMTAPGFVKTRSAGWGILP